MILDQQGAERLIGKGDMLLLGPTSSAPSRIQGSWVNEDEVRKVAAVWKRQAPEIDYDKEVQGAEDGGTARRRAWARAAAATTTTTSCARRWSSSCARSSARRRCSSASSRSASPGPGRLMDLLEQRGVVGPSEGSKARAVLMSVEELENAMEQGEV